MFIDCTILYKIISNTKLYESITYKYVITEKGELYRGNFNKRWASQKYKISTE